MNEIYLIAAVVTLLIVIFGILGEAIWKWMTRERGPWVVTRVGIGGREFYHWETVGGTTHWTRGVEWCVKFYTIKEATSEALRLLADVAPLSKYTGVDRG